MIVPRKKTNRATYGSIANSSRFMVGFIIALGPSNQHFEQWFRLRSSQRYLRELVAKHTADRQQHVFKRVLLVAYGLKHLLQGRQHAGCNEVGGSFMIHPLH